MHKYFFVLGQNHTLSKIEILSLLNKFDFYPKIISVSEEILIIETQKELDAQNFLKKLGGTIKIGEILDEISKNKFISSPEKILTDIGLLSKLFNPLLKKVSFGISVYNSGSKENVNKVYPSVMKLLPEIKKFLQTSYKVKFFRSHERSISSVSVVKNKLLTYGFELVISVNEDVIYLGKTLSVFDFEDYSLRDWQRPGKDTSIGMIPPKLAKIMINLSNADSNYNILDPFCGSGTIIQELILLGYKNITGSDYLKEQINKTNENLDWLFEKYKDIDQKEFNIKIFESDVRNLDKTIAPKIIDAIITEPFLGSPNLRHFNSQRIEEEIRTLEKLYLNAFSEFKKILKKNGKVVIIFPVFKVGQKEYFLNILPQISELDFRIKNYTEHLIYKNLQLEITKRGSIIYFRPDQIINREIFVFQINSGH